MTKIIVIEVDKSTNKIPQQTINYGLDRMIEGACNADGSWKKGWQPPGQAYIRVNSPGKYTVVHNQNRLDYSVSAALINSIGTLTVNNLTDVSFDVTIQLDKDNFANIPFRFAMNFTVKQNA